VNLAHGVVFIGFIDGTGLVRAVRGSP